MHYHIFSNQLVKLSSSSKAGSIIKEGEVILKKNPTVGLPEVSIKHSFFEKEILHKNESGFTMYIQKYNIT